MSALPPNLERARNAALAAVGDIKPAGPPQGTVVVTRCHVLCNGQYFTKARSAVVSCAEAANGLEPEFRIRFKQQRGRAIVVGHERHKVSEGDD